MKEIHEILVSVFDVNSFQRNIENLLAIIKKNGLKVNVARNKFVLVSCTQVQESVAIYEGWNFNSGNYLFTTDTK